MRICRKMFRPRTPATVEPAEKGLRGLYLVDLICDSIGGPLGLGVFVLLGYVARTAGPAVIIAVIFAAVIAGIAGGCYAELGSSAPKSGATAALALNLGVVGELVAFLVTWNLIADLAIGAAAAAKGIRASIDILTENTLSNYFREVAPLESEFTSSYVDFLALVIPIVAMLACSVFREYMLPRVAGTLFSIVLFLYMIIGGAFVANSSNWNIPPNCTESSCTNDVIGDGYFLPFGIASVFQGAAILMISFVDLGKGAYPRRSLSSGKEILPPISVITGFTIGFIFLFFIGLIVTMMQEYYLLIPAQEVVGVFSVIKYYEGIWIAGVGSIIVMFFTAETFAYTIAGELNTLSNEGVIFNFFGNVEIFGKKRPLYGVLTVGIISGLIGAFFTEAQLTEIVSIGTMISFGLIMCSSIIKRCQYNSHEDEKTSIGSVINQFLMCRKLKEPNFATSNAAKLATIIYSILCLGIGGLIAHFTEEIGLGHVWAVVTLIVLSILALYVLVVIELQPQRKSVPNFKVPLFPFFQALGILFTSFLIMNMNVWAWYRLALWSAIGLLMYAINWCMNPDNSMKSKIGSNSDVSALVASKSSISTKSKSSIQDVIISPEAILIRDKEWKPDDLRRYGWVQTEENEVNIELVDTLSLGSESGIAASSDQDPEPQRELVEVAVPEIVVSEILQANAASTPSSSRHEELDTPEFYARQLDEMFTFNVPADTDSHCSSSVAESAVEVHAVQESPRATHIVDKDTGESSASTDNRSVHFEDAASSDDDTIERVDDSLRPSCDEEEVIVAPSSPVPPPLPPANLVISAHLSAKSRPVAEPPVPEVDESMSHLNDFQIELRNTLKMRSQKMIDSIENQVVNVNEGIEIFGGRRSRDASISLPPGEEPVVVPVMKSGKFENHAFVEKLDSILKDRMTGVDNKRPRAKVYKQKRVVLQELPSTESDVPIRLSTAELMSAKSKLRSSTGESSSLGGELSNDNQSTPKANLPAKVSRKEPRSLDAFGSNIVIIEGQ